MRAKILNASAGSGKTYRLAYKYVRDTIEQPAIYRHILAVTFTNKATEEMKTRILKEIHTLASGGKSPYMEDLQKELELSPETIRQRAREVRSKILHDYSRFTVLTIDTFFQRIMRAFIKELGIDLNYNIELETNSILSKSTDSLIEQITVDQELKQWLIDFVQERIDEGNKWDIRDGILALGNELFKEKNKEVLTHGRTRHELKQIVQKAVSAAEASHQEMIQAGKDALKIMAAAGATPADFSGKSRSFAFYFKQVADGNVTKKYTDTVLKRSLSPEGWCPKGSSFQGLVPELQPLLYKICTLYDRNIRSWNTCALLKENYRSFALLSDLYAKVQQMCEEQNMMLLSETKYILSEFIGHNDVPFIYEKVGNRFDRFMIDEFQDTSVKEWENFLPLLQNAMAQSEEESVLIVGDIKQSIYRWRGGDWRLLHHEAQEALGHDDTEVENMKMNYRSLPVVVEFNNRVIGRIVEEDNLKLNIMLGEAVLRGDLPREEFLLLKDTLRNAYSHHTQIPRQRGEHPGYVSVETFEEKPPVVERICSLIDKGFAPSDIMILVRGKTDGAKVAAELLNFKQQNLDPRYVFDVMTQDALIIGSAPVSTFISSALRLTLNPDDRFSLATYNQFLQRPFDEELGDDERGFFSSLRLLSPEDAFERIVMHHDLQQDRRQTAYLQAIHEQILSFCANKIADIPLFLRWWDEQGSNRSLSIDQSSTTIEISTIHKAKGLEKRAVIIPYCSWQLTPNTSGKVPSFVWAEAGEGDISQIGRLPIRYKKAMGESDFSTEYFRETVYSYIDNINLLYVALTRAKESLHIFVPGKGKGQHIGVDLISALSTSTSSSATEEATVRAATQSSTKASQEDSPLESPQTTDTSSENTPSADETDAKTDSLLQARQTLTEEGGLRFEYGEFAAPVLTRAQTSETRHIVLEHYLTTRADLSLRLPSQRYLEEEAAELSPRNFGILMHKSFQEAETLEDIQHSIERLRRDELLSPEDEKTLRHMIDNALENPTIRSWFDGSWDEVRNENDIIRPGGSTRRPDRVMIRQNGEVVVVDYKFGDNQLPSYHRQVSQYLDLLRQMGYSSPRGYLWYVKLGIIENVD